MAICSRWLHEPQHVSEHMAGPLARNAPWFVELQVFVRQVVGAAVVVGLFRRRPFDPLDITRSTQNVQITSFRE